MLKSLPLFLGLVFLGACSDDTSLDRQDNTRENNGGIIITTDTGVDTSNNDTLIDSDCGNAIVDEGEDCDDGNVESGDYCAADCREITGSCGDAIVQANEVCDGDECTADCQSLRTTDCGNGQLDAGEICDDGNLAADDYCAVDCSEVTGACGDNMLQANEICDDGNQVDADYCNNDCSSVTGSCADGIKQDNEICDDGNVNDDDYCKNDCSEITGTCGDGAIQNNEVCDDGNQSEDDYCKADCSLVTGECGDGTIQMNEACDDGNTTDGDYCDAICGSVTGSCGDGVVQSNESCDDQATADCANTHDGGDGTCVATTACSAGYMLNSSGVCISTNTTGLSTPCSQAGGGYTMFKIHYDNGSTSARVDVWDANCNYSFASNSACNVREVCRGFCDVPTTGGGNPIFNTSNYWRARYNATGFNFTNATLWVQARGTQGSTRFRAWSPLYGDVMSGLVNGSSYDWYSVDWSNHLSPLDQPSLTAIQIYGINGPIAVQSVELCVQ